MIPFFPRALVSQEVSTRVACRYLPPREEDKVKPFSYVGFGGGRHGCMGTNFAYLQVQKP